MAFDRICLLVVQSQGLHLEHIPLTSMCCFLSLNFHFSIINASEVSREPVDTSATFLQFSQIRKI